MYDNMFYNWQMYETASAPHTLTSAVSTCLQADTCLLAGRCMRSTRLHAAPSSAAAVCMAAQPPAQRG